MFRKFLLLSSLVLAPACSSAREADVQTFTVRPGQGQYITMSIPAPESQAPYALTGEKADASLPMRTVQYGQSGWIWVPQGR